MRIWVDADACPNVIKDILYRAAERTATEVTLVANQPLTVPRSALIKTVRVGAGFDVADARIVALCEPGDLVVTADIPLAAEAIERGALALSPRGELHTADTIRERLIMRDLMDELRGTGIDTGGPPALDAGDRREFANQLDRLLVKGARGPS